MPKKYPPPNVAVGDEFTHKYKGTIYTMRIVKVEEGIGYEVESKIFRSPTAAAKAVVGEDQFVNGRKFWKIK